MTYRSPAEIAEEIVIIGKNKAKLSAMNTFILATLAGVYLAFAGQLMLIVSHDAALNLGIGMTRFIAGSVFSVGLILIVLAGAELFTGNSLLAVGYMQKQFKAKAILRNWSLVYLGNFVGSVLIVGLIYYSGLWALAGGAIGKVALKIALSKVEIGFWTALVRGIGANWLVCIAIWMAISGKTNMDRILGIYFPIMTFVVLGFEHSIANMFFLPMGLFLKNVVSVAGAGQLTISSMFLNNLIPVTIGNIIGGVFFVALPYWFVYLRKKQQPIVLSIPIIDRVSVVRDKLRNKV